MHRDDKNSAADRRSPLDFLLDAEFGKIATFPRIQVPGYPSFEHFPQPSANEETDTPERFHSLFAPNFLARFDVGDSEVALCNKRVPHSLTDAMLIQSDPDVRTRFGDLSQAQQVFMVRAAREFAAFVSEPGVARKFELKGGFIHVTYNTSAETGDRENGMGYTKRFHLHLNFWRRREFAGAQLVHLGHLPMAIQHELLDPFTPLASAIILHGLKRRGVFSGHRVLDVRAEEVRFTGLPPGVAIELPNWDALLDPTFIPDLSALQQIVVESFADLRVAFTGQSAPASHWTRHPLLEPGEIEANLEGLDLPDEVRPLLSRLAYVLRTITPRHGAFFRRNKSLRVRNMMMNGANFSVGFVSMAPNLEPLAIDQAGPVWLTLQHKMLSTMGSAGIFSNALAPIIRIARNARHFSADEEALRLGFQHEFAQRLVHI